MLGLSSIAKRFFGSANDRKLRRYSTRLARINALEADFEQLDELPRSQDEITKVEDNRLADSAAKTGVLLHRVCDRESQKKVDRLARRQKAIL